MKEEEKKGRERKRGKIVDGRGEKVGKKERMRGKCLGEARRGYGTN